MIYKPQSGYSVKKKTLHIFNFKYFGITMRNQHLYFFIIKVKYESLKSCFKGINVFFGYKLFLNYLKLKYIKIYFKKY